MVVDVLLTFDTLPSVTEIGPEKPKGGMNGRCFRPTGETQGTQSRSAALLARARFGSDQVTLRKMRCSGQLAHELQELLLVNDFHPEYACAFEL